MKTSIIKRKAKDGKVFSVAVFQAYCSDSEKPLWTMNRDFFYTTKAKAMIDAKICLQNMIEDYQDTNNL